MKYLDAWFRQPDSMLHPMQEVIRFGDVIEYEELVAWNLLPEESIEYELFYVEADRERYTPAIEMIATVIDYQVAPIDDESFYVLVCERTREPERRLRQAFTELGLLVVPPIVYDDDAALEMTVVGAEENLRMLADAVPDEIDVTVNEIGAYNRHHTTIAGRPTDRQLEAVEIAADVGYYDVPREATLADVARELDCAESTASVLLRRAESRVMSRLVER